jgi:glutamyl-tRNA reductase
MGPVIDRLYRRYHRMAQEELARTRGKLCGQLGEQDEAHLEDMVRRLVNKLLHNPVQVLRQGPAAGPHTPPAGYLHAFQKLFQVGDGMESDPLPERQPDAQDMAARTEPAEDDPPAHPA